MGSALRPGLAKEAEPPLHTAPVTLTRRDYSTGYRLFRRKAWRSWAVWRAFLGQTLLLASLGLIGVSLFYAGKGAYYQWLGAPWERVAPWLLRKVPIILVATGAGAVGAMVALIAQLALKMRKYRIDGERAHREPVAGQLAWNEERLGIIVESVPTLVPIKSLHLWDETDAHLFILVSDAQFFPIPIGQIGADEAADIKRCLEESGVQKGWRVPVGGPGLGEIFR